MALSSRHQHIYLGFNTNDMQDFITIENRDSIVFRIIQKFRERSDVGQKKYGTTLDRQDLELLDWITHLQEEMMDAILYCEKLKDENERLKRNINDSPSKDGERVL